MNDATEIKKALEDFYHRAENTNLSYHIFESEREVLKDALALINRQQVEIERLQNTIDDILDREPLLVERAEKYAREEFAERLKETDGYNNHTFDDCASIFISEEYRKGRDEKIKEIWNTIDCLKKEMAGEKNA